MNRRTSLSLLSALGCVAVAALTWVLAFRTGFGQSADASALRAFGTIRGTRAELPIALIAFLCNPAPYALLSLPVIGLARANRGPRAALIVGAVLLVTNLVSQALKRGLAEDRVAGTPTTLVHVDPISWPSGHATAAMALALCAVIAAPATARWLVAVGGALFAIAVAYAVVVLGWHFPSDAIGGFAVAGAGASLGVAALSAAPEAVPAPPRPWSLAAPLAVLGLGVLAVALALVAVSLPGPRQQAAFLAGGGVIVVLGLALAAAVAGFVSRPAATAALASRWPRARG